MDFYLGQTRLSLQLRLSGVCDPCWAPSFVHGNPLDAAACPFVVRESTWLRKKMPHAKVGELARGLLLAAGVPAGDLKRITPKSARKSNSTGGGILFFPDSLAHGLGNWQEITKGERLRSSRAIFTMPLTYSDAPLLTSGAAKGMVLASYSQCADDLCSLQLSTDSEIQWGVVRKANFDLSALLAVFEGSDWEIASSIIAQ